MGKLASLLRLPGAAARRRCLSWSCRPFAVLRAWQERSRQRDQLKRLDDRLLKDIALTRTDIEREVRKRFWRP